MIASQVEKPQIATQIAKEGEIVQLDLHGAEAWALDERRDSLEITPAGAGRWEDPRDERHLPFVARNSGITSVMPSSDNTNAYVTAKPSMRRNVQRRHRRLGFHHGLQVGGFLSVLSVRRRATYFGRFPVHHLQESFRRFPPGSTDTPRASGSRRRIRAHVFVVAPSFGCLPIRGTRPR